MWSPEELLKSGVKVSTSKGKEKALRKALELLASAGQEKEGQHGAEKEEYP